MTHYTLFILPSMAGPLTLTLGFLGPQGPLTLTSLGQYGPLFLTSLETFSLVSLGQ